MSNAKGYVGRKAAKATVRHTVHGTASKVRRDPLRTSTLLGAGVLIGAVLALVLQRRSAPAPDAAPAPPAAAQPGPQPDPNLGAVIAA